jgi:hypothetical protein
MLGCQWTNQCLADALFEHVLAFFRFFLTRDHCGRTQLFEPEMKKKGTFKKQVDVKVRRRIRAFYYNND